MDVPVARGIALARTVAAEAKNRDVTFLAAAVAYYAFVSLVPLVGLTIAVASFFGEEALEALVLSIVGGLLTESGTDLLTTAVTGETGRGGATFVGIAILSWGTLKSFRGLDRAFSRVYGHDTAESLGDQLQDAVVVVGLIGFGMVVLVGVGVAARLLPENDWLSLVAPLGTLVPLFVVFLPIYYVFPDVELTVREALPGAVFAAVAWTTLGWLFSLYASQAGTYAVYGLLGGVLLAVTWLYFGAIVLMVGAIVNAVLAGRIGDWRRTGTSNYNRDDADVSGESR